MCIKFGLLLPNIFMISDSDMIFWDNREENNLNGIFINEHNISDMLKYCIEVTQYRKFVKLSNPYGTWKLGKLTNSKSAQRCSHAIQFKMTVHWCTCLGLVPISTIIY